VYFLPDKDAVEHNFFTNSKIVDEGGTLNLRRPPLTRFIWYLAENPAVQVYISPSEFITVDWNKRTETQREIIRIFSDNHAR
jgi:hypothetical protein